MANWFKIHSLQLLIGTVLAILPLIYLIYSGLSWQPLNPHDHFIQNLMAYLFLVLFSYFNHTQFVPRWLLAKKYGHYALVAGSCIISTAYLPHRIEQWFFFKPPQQHTPTAWIKQLFKEEMMLGSPPAGPLHAKTNGRSPYAKHAPNGIVSRSPGDSSVHEAGNLLKPPMGLGLSAKLAIFFLLATVSTLLSISVQMANRLGRVENDQLRAELQQLKAQIQPHFLFNALNSIYALSIRQDERTSETIVKLAEFMRYIIRDAHRDQVPLMTELSYITNYIDLQQARLQDAVQLDYQLEGDGSRLQIAPLLLIAFIENAFKYGVNPEEYSPIVIHIRIGESRLHLYVFNHKVEVNLSEPSTGIGLPNAQERLRLLYPATHQLTIDDTPAHFCVNLLLTLSE